MIVMFLEYNGTVARSVASLMAMTLFFNLLLIRAFRVMAELLMGGFRIAGFERPL